MYAPSVRMDGKRRSSRSSGWCLRSIPPPHCLPHVLNQSHYPRVIGVEKLGWPRASRYFPNGYRPFPNWVGSKESPAFSQARSMARTILRGLFLPPLGFLGKILARAAAADTQIIPRRFQKS